MEGASGRRVQGAGDLAGHGDALVGAGLDGIRHGNGRDQGAGVGVERTLVDLVRTGQLDHVAEVHDRDPVGNMAHDEEVVGDEEVGQVELLLELVKHVDDLGLDRDVQGGDGLVADDEVGVDRQGTGDADTLALASGELMGVAGGVLGVEADVVHQFQDTLAALLFGLVHVLDIQGLADDVGDGHAGIQRGIGILEDHGGLAAVVCDVLRGLDGLAAVDDLAAGGLVEVQDGAAGGRLAAARLSDQTQGLALHDVKGDVVDSLERLCLEKSRADREILFQMADADERLAIRVLCSHTFLHIEALCAEIHEGKIAKEIFPMQFPRCDQTVLRRFSTKPGR